MGLSFSLSRPPGSGNVCEGLSGNATQAVDINAGMDGAWFDPDTTGQGFFIDAHPDPKAAVLMTRNPPAQAMWAP
jgi:hypothetical protein